MTDDPQPDPQPDAEHDPELRALLRGADPAASLPPADPARVAQLLEDVMSKPRHGEDVSTTTGENRASGTRGRSPLTWLVAAAAVALIGVLGVGALLGADDEDDVPTAGDAPAVSDDAEPSVTRLEVADAPAGRCMVPTPEVLAGASLAFEGTVTELVDGTAVLEPSEFFAGRSTDTVEVTAPSEDLQALVSAVDFQVGERYLVAADGAQVMVCGFSDLATPAQEQLYAEAFNR
ncbi:hypothetical protein [Nocardioides sp. Leaf307]|uniref:hypothetical protein n=1 Tax=Nocardioides sp. Leaf307 TaxID=1736331 RepID=UPI000702F2B7|nr:hypothetical protein [Nocardioides sp. Leaf307]KQQ43024.1 hypothetical protein ASF50_03195 [Nocardioides sp. Leaf307]